MASGKQELFEAAIAGRPVHVGHAGRDKTWTGVRGKEVKEGAIDSSLKTCTGCGHRLVSQSLLPGKAMINLTFLLRAQINRTDF